MRFWLRALAALVIAFVLNAFLRAGFHQAFGQRMLEAAAWTPGTRPPTTYMTLSVIVALAAASVAGIGAALIMGRARIRHAIASGALFAGLAFWANRATLFDNPHPYEWPLIVAPLLAMPLGAWLIVYLKPLRASQPTNPFAV